MNPRNRHRPAKMPIPMLHWHPVTIDIFFREHQYLSGKKSLNWELPMHLKHYHKCVPMLSQLVKAWFFCSFSNQDLWLLSIIKIELFFVNSLISYWKYRPEISFNQARKTQFLRMEINVTGSYAVNNLFWSFRDGRAKLRILVFNNDSPHFRPGAIYFWLVLNSN